MTMKIVNDYMPVIPDYSGTSTLLAVCTLDHVGYYAVYIGIVPVTDKDRRKLAEWVMYNGVKQSYEKAIQYFPALPREQYRG